MPSASGGVVGAGGFLVFGFSFAFASIGLVGGRLLILMYGLSGLVLRGACNALRAGGVALFGVGGVCAWGDLGGALYLFGWGSVGNVYGCISGAGHAPLGAGGRLPSIGGGGGGLWSWYTACQ